MIYKDVLNYIKYSTTGLFSLKIWGILIKSLKTCSIQYSATVESLTLIPEPWNLKHEIFKSRKNFAHYHKKVYFTLKWCRKKFRIKKKNSND